MHNAFECTNLVKSYPGFQLGPLNLHLEVGRIIGYIGPNGAGKSTTMHCLTGLVKPEEGEIQIFNRRNDPARPEWKHDIGYVGDVHPFYENWSGEKNLRFIAQFYPSWSDDRLLTLIKRFDVPWRKKVKDLSTGNRVKLALVAALAHNPKLLLLDEPMSNLDPVVRTEVMDALFELMGSGDRAIFYSTHILSEVGKLADELVFLDKGHIILRTPKDDLTDRWRKISFRLAEDRKAFDAAVVHWREGHDHQVISTDATATLQQIRALDAENIQETRLSLEEIAVQILKGGIHVETSESGVPV